MSLQRSTTSSCCRSSVGRPSVLAVVLVLVGGTLLFNAVSAVIEEDDVTLDRQIITDGRTHYNLSSDLVRALRAIGLQLSPLQSALPTNNTGGGGGGGPTGPCVVLVGRGVVRRQSAADVADAVALFSASAANDVDVESAHVTTVSLSFVEFRRKPRRSKHSRRAGVAATSHDHHREHSTADDWCASAITSSRHVASSSTTPITTTAAPVSPTEDRGRADRGRGQVDNLRQNDNDTLSTMAAYDKSMTSNQHDASGLNRLTKRQILVISTCSTVIGTFSVVALILRIRNCMKRSKQDKDSARRHGRSNSLNVHRSRHHHGSLDAFGPGHDDRHDRRWSHFNPFSTDR